MNKARIQQILASSFKDNKSTNFVIKQDAKNAQRMKVLLEYSIFYAEKFGHIYVNKEESACALVLDSEKKKTTLSSIKWDVKLILKCAGIAKINALLKREKLIHATHPKSAFLHLWYIGVDPEEQGKGKGSTLLKEIQDFAREAQKDIYLETSTPTNFNFYKKLGFEEINTFDDLGFTIKCYRWKV